MHRAVKLTNIILVASIALAVTACNNTGGAGGSAASNAGDAAATVNGKAITLKEVDTILAQQAKSQQTDMSKMSPLEIATARLQVVDDLIKQEVLYQRADKDKLTPTEDDINQEINQQMQQNGVTQEAYQKMLKDSGQTEQELREVARKQIAIRKLMDRVVSKIGTPSDKEVEDFYNNNKQRYVSARGVGLATIVVDPRDNPGAADDAKSETDAKTKIDIIYQRLKSNGAFADVAREKSEDSQSSLRGGDLGFIAEDQLKQGGFPPDLITKFFTTMQVGDFTQPIRTPDGRWTIFKLTERRLQNENLTFDNAEVKKDATDNIINQRKQILNAALIEVAMNEAKVVNNLASKMLDSPSNLSGLRPAQSPSSAATPALSPAASASGSPVAATSATPPVVKPATPAAQPSPKKP